MWTFRQVVRRGGELLRDDPPAAAEQPAVLSRIGSWLRHGGWFAATLGHTAWTGTEDDWLGGGTTMLWSHADADTYRSWITATGLVVPDGPNGSTGAERRYADR
jgi:hypothetical protein